VSKFESDEEHRKQIQKKMEELRQRRRKWVDANRENGFEEGINNLLTQLYPDNAHFIYELLQNAEDTSAIVVRFTLTDLVVEFEHDGERLFSFSDVESITSIGKSTKRDDPTSIGKFGVGFKAVFAYTNTPEVHSGNFHFRIHDLVVPETEGVSCPKMGDRETCFAFPFDNPKKLQGKAVGEIERGLRALGNNTLLFLSHIRKIEYLLPDGALGTLDRIEHQDGRIEIRASQPTGEETISHWLLFDKDVEVTDEDREPKTCRIAIAYSLIEEDRKKKQSKWKIVPLKHGQVSIYFPAEKENSGLRFHIHAPFASTVARDSVRDCQANEDLRDHLKHLVVESLTTIRDREMLDVSFLAVLPNPADNLPEFYEPIRDAIVEAFGEQDLTPTRSGEHRSARALYRGPPEIAKVLGDNELSSLTEFSVPLWAANAPQENQREDRFIQSLEIGVWGWSELASIFKQPHQYAYIETFIQQMSDAELMRFYALLGKAVDVQGESVDIDDLRIVRVTNDNGDNHVTPKEAYFQPEGGTVPPSDVFFVKPDVYSTGRSAPQKKFAKSFLETVGVRVYDEHTGIERLLALYGSDSSIAQKAHQKHIRQFIAFWKRLPDESGMFRANKFLQGVTENGVLAWFAPSQLCLDKPYLDTGLAKLTGIHKKYTLAGGYEAFLKGAQLDDFVAFMKAVEVMYKLDVINVPVYSDNVNCCNPKHRELQRDYRAGTRWTNTATNKDYSIAGLVEYLNAHSIDASRLIWVALKSAKPEAAYAIFRPNKNFDVRTEESQIICRLTNTNWIPDNSGEFRLPQEMTQDDLRTDFPFDDHNGLLTAIGFGEKARQCSEEYCAKNQEARKLGLPSVEVAEELAEILKSGVSIDEIRALKQNRKRDLSDKVSHSEKRATTIADEVRSTHAKMTEVRSRTVNTDYTQAQIDARVYLKDQCKDDDGVMLCQICQKAQPVMLNDEPYFEAVDCISNLKKEGRYNKLALCPNHAAMYKNGDLSPDVIQQAILECEGQGIQLNLAGNEVELCFSKQHLSDLRAMLNALDSVGK
jgi:hypothetical protein